MTTATEAQLNYIRSLGRQHDMPTLSSVLDAYFGDVNHRMSKSEASDVITWLKAGCDFQAAFA